MCIPSFNEYGVCTRLDTFQLKVPPMCKSIFLYFADEVSNEDFHRFVHEPRENLTQDIDYLKKIDLEFNISRILKNRKFLKSRVYGLSRLVSSKPEWWLAYLCYDRSFYSTEDILKTIKSIPSVVGPSKLKRHFFLP